MTTVETTPEPARPERRGAVAVPADRGLRVPLQLPHRARSSPRTARSTGCAFRASTRRACSAACSTARPGSSASRRSGSTTRPRGAYVPGTNVLETTWKTPQRLDRRPRRADHGALGPRGRDHAAHPPPGRRRRRPHARPHGRVPRGPRRGRARLRAGLRLRPHAGGLDAGRRRPPHRRCARAPDQTIRLQSDLPLGIEGNRVRGRHVLADRATARTARSRGPKDLVAPQDREEAEASIAATIRFWRAWLQRAPASRTTAGATRSSAPRSRSRA